MPRPKAGERVLGPYKHYGKWRVIHFHPGRVGPDGREQTIEDVATEEDALILKKVWQKTVDNPALTVAKAMVAFLAHKREDQREEATIAGYTWALEAMFPDRETMLVSELARPEKCLALYTKLRKGRAKTRDGAFATDSHRNILVMSRSFVRWCAAFPQRYLTRNGFEEIKGIGRRNRGKPKLTIDEARRFLSTAAVRANAGDQGAVAAMMTLLLGMRTSEVARRRVRDVDDDGRLLRIMRQRQLGQRTKTDSSQRNIALPPFLQPYLQALIKGKRPTDWLWDPIRNGSGAATGKILEAIAAAPGTTTGPAIAAATGIDIDVVQVLLCRLVKGKAVIRLSRGLYRRVGEGEGPAALEVRREIAEGWEPNRLWVLKSVKRICLAAGTVLVTAHSMRGLQSDLATIGGLDELLADVARGLGHEGTRVMEAHYQDAGVRADETQARALSVLMGGRRGPRGKSNDAALESSGPGNETRRIITGAEKSRGAK
jgi:integrase